jgi:transposase
MAEDQTEIEALKAENARLRAELEKLRAVVERLQRGQKRQAAPFSKGPPKLDPKKPGRRSGDDYGPIACRKAPAEIDETYVAALPEECPFCGSGVEFVSSAEHYQAEIPRKPIHRKFNVVAARRICCARRS